MLRSILILAMAAGTIAAQDPPSRAGRISYVSGAVSFQPAGVTDWAPATTNRPLTIGDQLYADNGARAEVAIPGTTFRLGDRTAFEFMNLDDHATQIRLSEGTLDVRVRHLTTSLEIDTPNLAFTVSGPGEFRLDTNADSGQTLITARDGEGQVSTANGSFTLRAGQQAVVAGQDQNAQYQVNPAPALDAFDQWAMSRNTRADRYARQNYVSQDMVGYEDLGEYGSWQSAPDYGHVWYPNSVAANWAPYQDGHWAWVDPWGWSWVDEEPWGFAPFHYGRWALVSGRWGWCPGPVAVVPVYAPALVAWVGFGGVGVSVGFGGGPGVGWFPLGPRDVYIPSFGASAGFVNRVNVSNTTIINTTIVNNVYNTYTRTHTMPVNSYMYHSTPNAMMAVPQHTLVNAENVRRAAVRVQPNQIAAIRTVEPAPHVAPQVSSVLGHAAGGNAPRPPAAVLSRQVVARTAPPAPPVSFQQRQAVLARNPGRPMPVAQLHQAGPATAAAGALRPPVRVVNNARQITPTMGRPGAPVPAPTAQQQRPGVNEPPRTATVPPARQAPQTPQRGFEPPTAQRPGANQPRTATVPPARQAPPTPQRGFEPPTAQRPGANQPPRTATVPPARQRPGANQPPRTATVPPERQAPQTPQRGFEPPTAQRPGANQPPRTATAPPTRQAPAPQTPQTRKEPQASRSQPGFEPPAAQRRIAPTQAPSSHTPAPVERTAPRVQSAPRQAPAPQREAPAPRAAPPQREAPPQRAAPPQHTAPPPQHAAPPPQHAAPPPQHAAPAPRSQPEKDKPEHH